MEEQQIHTIFIQSTCHANFLALENILNKNENNSIHVFLQIQ